MSDPWNPLPSSFVLISGDLFTVTHTEQYTRTADTVWHVQTGGMAIPGRNSLWQFNGSASEILDKRATPPFFSSAMREVTNKTQIAIGSLGNLKADGNLWLALPDGADKDITPTLAGKDFYTFGVSGQKYNPYINLSSATTNADLSPTNVPEVCVGQTVNFTLNWSPNLPSGVVIGEDTLQHWTLPSKFVNQKFVYWNGSPECDTYITNWDLLINTNLVRCWFVNGNGGTVGTWQNLHFNNGQYVGIAAVGQFTVYRPSAGETSQILLGRFGQLL